MKNQDSLMPFGYVRTQGRMDVEESRAFMPNWEESDISAVVTVGAGLLPGDYGESERLLFSPDSRLRTAMVALITKWWPTAPRFTKICATMAIEDSSPCVRGTALRALVHLRNQCDNVDAVVADVIGQHFPIKSEHRDVALGAAWMDALANVCATGNDREIASLYDRKVASTLERLAGSRLGEIASSKKEMISVLL